MMGYIFRDFLGQNNPAWPALNPRDCTESKLLGTKFFKRIRGGGGLFWKKNRL